MNVIFGGKEFGEDGKQRGANGKGKKRKEICKSTNLLFKWKLIYFI